MVSSQYNKCYPVVINNAHYEYYISFNPCFPVPFIDSVNATSASAAPPASSSSVLTTPSKIEPMKAFDSRFTERSKATSGTAVVTNTNQTVVDR